MRLHTSKLTAADVYRATADLDGVYADVTTHGSRSRLNGLEVSLEGNGYLVNSGSRGAGAKIGATWDEWGVVIARLFDLDPDAFWGSAKYPVYRDEVDFHRKTADRFLSLELPEDTHKRHNWQGSFRARYCTKCTAEQHFDL